MRAKEPTGQASLLVPEEPPSPSERTLCGNERLTALNSAIDQLGPPDSELTPNSIMTELTEHYVPQSVTNEREHKSGSHVPNNFFLWRNGGRRHPPARRASRRGLVAAAAVRRAPPPAGRGMRPPPRAGQVAAARSPPPPRSSPWPARRPPGGPTSSPPRLALVVWRPKCQLNVRKSNAFFGIK